MGLLDPATSDGRVIFFLPWEKVTIAGTTDSPTSVTAHPIPGEDDINFILNEVRNYLSPDVEGTGPSVSCLLCPEQLKVTIHSGDCVFVCLCVCVVVSQCGEGTCWQRGAGSAPW